jgi:hypothetical protein
MKTLVATPDPEEPEGQPEIVYCITSLGPGDSGFSVPAVLPRPMYGWATTTSTTNGTVWNVTYG